MKKIILCLSIALLVSFTLMAQSRTEDKKGKKDEVAKSTLADRMNDPVGLIPVLKDEFMRQQLKKIKAGKNAGKKFIW